MKKRRLKRDKVVSVVNGQALVGVYWGGTDGSEILFECSPDKADRIIAIFNEEEGKDAHQVSDRERRSSASLKGPEKRS